jgi:TPR repeat protein
MHRLLLTLLLLFATDTISFADDFSDAMAAFRMNDYATAFGKFKKAAESGNTDAQGMVGAMYDDGVGTLQDYVQAVRWYTKAAEAGNTAAQNSLGRMHFNGKGVKQDYLQAVRWFTKAAEAGNAKAQTSLGVMYNYGMGVAQDYLQAVRWFTKAAEAGDAVGQYCLGLMYAKGMGVAQDYLQAARWYTKAAEAGDDDAQSSLGWLYTLGLGVPQDYGQAARWLTKAAEAGNVSAQVGVGSLYNEGLGVPQDYVQAVRWYTKAAEAENTIAQYSLGWMYAKGNGVAQDYLQAVRWFTKAAEAGDVEAQSDLGWLYFNGKGVAQDYLQAAHWLTKAAEAGNAIAQHNLGLLYEYGNGVAQDSVQAYKWYNLAAVAQTDKDQRDRTINKRDRVAGTMTAQQLAEGQRLAREWKPKMNISPARQQETSGSQPTASGTGFIISRQGHVLTNNHVIDGCMTIRTTNEDRKMQLTVVGTDPENDLALLKLPSPSPNIARFREGRNIRAGDGVVTVGFPLHGLLASEANVTTGAVSALAGIGNDTRFLQITVPIQPGSSGGPLLDQSGNIVGIIVGKLDAIKIAKTTGDLPQNINFAINGAVAKSFLDANSVEYELASSGKKLESSDVGRQAKHFTLLLECFK